MEAFSYDEVCRIVGDLYLNSRKMIDQKNSNNQAVVELNKARQEIAALTAELERIKFVGKQDS
jgi:hypothetical protein